MMGGHSEPSNAPEQNFCVASCMLALSGSPQPCRRRLAVVVPRQVGQRQLTLLLYARFRWEQQPHRVDPRVPRRHFCDVDLVELSRVAAVIGNERLQLQEYLILVAVKELAGRAVAQGAAPLLSTRPSLGQDTAQDRHAPRGECKQQPHAVPWARGAASCPCAHWRLVLLRSYPLQCQSPTGCRAAVARVAVELVGGRVPRVGFCALLSPGSRDDAPSLAKFVHCRLTRPGAGTMPRVSRSSYT